MPITPPLASFRSEGIFPQFDNFLDLVDGFLAIPDIARSLSSESSRILNAVYHRSFTANRHGASSGVIIPQIDYWCPPYRLPDRLCALLPKGANFGGRPEHR